MGLVGPSGGFKLFSMSRTSASPPATSAARRMAAVSSASRINRQSYGPRIDPRDECPALGQVLDEPIIP